MPSDLANYFLDQSKPVVKLTYVVNQCDYDFIKSVFPEHGFMAYFPGYNLRLLAEALRRHKINGFADRLYSPALANPAALSVIARDAWDKTILLTPPQSNPKVNDNTRR
jgi:hypothetical protein